MQDILILLAGLVIILAGAELFVNAVEWIGRIYKLSEGATGSVLAAVGTALPETMIPIIAIVFGPGDSGHDIGIGAILGAPLMLSTLAMFVTGAAVFCFAFKRKTGLNVVASYQAMVRDLSFFIVLYALAILAGIIDFRAVKVGIGIVLVAAYAFYVHRAMKEKRDGEEEEYGKCYFAPKSSWPATWIVLVQALCALVCIVAGANLFVGSVTVIAARYGIPAFVLALIITPIATELPEKFNSVIWISRGKDTLALGNITGAMVFQSSLIPALGIMLTDWQLTSGALFSGLLALASGGLLLAELKMKKLIRVHFLALGGLFYLGFILAVVWGWIR
jgi:cation:H+ antiporter